MCGIAGFFDPSTHSPEWIKSMGDRMDHRGPDDHGEWIASGLHLAHRRLSIVDLSTGHQPMLTPERDLAIVFNGEIYNHSELRSQFFSASNFQTQCDTEILLHAYRKWGKGMLSHLNGMFAFCIADVPGKKLLLARDRLGQKPLYYTQQGSRFAFSSEIPSLLELPWMDRSLSRGHLGEYFAHEHIPYPNTPFTHIKKLGPGELLELDLEKLEVEPQRWWTPSFTVEQKYSSFNEAQEHFMELWDRSLRYRMMADVPLGIFLSGGLDSSSCLAQLRHLFPDRNLQTFSVGFENKSFDETSYAQLMAKHCQSEHHEATLTPEAMLSVLPEIERHMLDPIADASIIPTTLLCQHAKKNVTVAIGGDAADELLCGYPTFYAHKMLGNWPWPKPLRSALTSLTKLLPTNMDNLSLDFKIKQTLKGLGQSNPIRNEIWLGGGDMEQINTLFSGGGHSLNQLYRHDLQRWQDCDAPSLLAKIQDLYLHGYLTDGILTKVDRASMFNSLEVRSPFLDVHLVEFFNSLPMAYKMKGNCGKILLKRAMASKLPAEIISRPKKGFGMPISHWFRHELKDMLYARIENAPDFLNKKYLFQLFEEHQKGLVDHRKILFSFFMLDPVFKAAQR
jgi:asparagine synthase (glutamine-hydrolysing)